MSKSSCSHSRNSENLNLNHCCQTSKYDSDGDINMQVLFSSPRSIPSINYFILHCDINVYDMQVLFSNPPSILLSFISAFYLAGGVCQLYKARCCPQPCSVFSYQSSLYLAISSLMTGQPEGQGKGIQRRGGNCKRESKVDNKDRSVLRMLRSVRKAMIWVPAILEG